MKPILYHDIDGVLFGDYAGYFQLRPNVKGWLYFAHEHFEVVWLTTWEPAEIKQLLEILYAEKYTLRLEAPGFQVADWYKFESKELWLASQKRKDWYWVDDSLPPASQLIAIGIDPDRCILVKPKGETELEILKQYLMRFTQIGVCSDLQTESETGL